MLFFIDSANPDEVSKAYATGMIDGVTTNPTLASRAGIPYKEAVERILKEVDGPVSLEVLSTDTEGMITEARKLVTLGSNVVVKLPMGIEGIRAAQILKNEDVKINMTLVFSSAQALLCAKAKVDYVSPFIGRLDDLCLEGLDLIAEIRDIFDNYQFSTKILTASVRSPLHVSQVASLGSDVATLPPEIFWKLFKHPLTDIGLSNFLKDFEEAGVTPLV